MYPEKNKVHQERLRIYMSCNKIIRSPYKYEASLLVPYNEILGIFPVRYYVPIKHDI